MNYKKNWNSGIIENVFQILKYKKCGKQAHKYFKCIKKAFEFEII